MIPIFALAVCGALITAGAKLAYKQLQKRPHVQRSPKEKSSRPPEENGKALTFVGTLQKFKADTLDPLFEDMRSQHLKEISLDGEVLSQEQKMANQHFVFASMLLASMSTCALLYPPLLLLHIPPRLYLSMPLYKEAFEDLVRKRRVTTAVADAMLGVGALAYAAFKPQILLLSAVGGWIFAYTNKVIARIKVGTRKNLTHLMGEQPQYVWVLQDDVEVEVPFESVQVGDLVVLNAGEMIPVDGLIDQGVAAIDQHMLTGESQPAEKGVGDPVFAATVVLSGRIIIQVQKTGQETAVPQIGHMLMQTADFTSSVELRGKEIADRAHLLNKSG